MKGIKDEERKKMKANRGKRRGKEGRKRRMGRKEDK